MSSDSEETESDKETEDDGEIDSLSRHFLSLADNNPTETNTSTDNTHISLSGQDDPEGSKQLDLQTAQPAPAQPPATKRTRSAIAKVPYSCLSDYVKNNSQPEGQL